MQVRQAIENDVSQIAKLQRDWEREGATHSFVAATEEQIRALVGSYNGLSDAVAAAVGR